MIDGLCYTYPTSGTIRLGHARRQTTGDREMRVPVMDDEFTLTTKITNGADVWQRHPLDATLRRTHAEEVSGDGEMLRKLRSIPVTLVFDMPKLNIAEQYSAFGDDGAPLCVGNGKTARRRQDSGDLTDEVCPGSQHCSFGRLNQCRMLMRLLVRVEGQPETAAPFILRSGSVHAVTDNRATLEYWYSMLGGRLAGLPFRLVLVAGQTSSSDPSIFYWARLEADFGTVTDAARMLQRQRADDIALGIDREAAEQKLLALRGNGGFADEAAQRCVEVDVPTGCRNA